VADWKRIDSGLPLSRLRQQIYLTIRGSVGAFHYSDGQPGRARICATRSCPQWAGIVHCCLRGDSKCLDMRHKGNHGWSGHRRSKRLMIKGNVICAVVTPMCGWARGLVPTQVLSLGSVPWDLNMNSRIVLMSKMDFCLGRLCGGWRGRS